MEGRGGIVGGRRGDHITESTSDGDGGQGKDQEEAVEAQVVNENPRADEEEAVEAQVLNENRRADEEEAVEAQVLNENPRADEEEPVADQGFNESPRADEKEPAEDQVLNESPRADEEKQGEEEEPGEAQVLSGRPQADAQALIFSGMSSHNNEQLVRRNPRATTEEDHPIYGKVLPPLKKAVIKLFTDGEKSLTKAMKIADEQDGVVSVSFQEQNRLEVTGDGLDSARLVTLLRKKVGHAELISVAELIRVGPVERKVEEKKVEEKEVEPLIHSIVYA